MRDRIGQCVVLCGGLGTRLGALTAERPKPLLEVAGRPFLEILLEAVGRQGCRSVLLLAGFRAGDVSDFVAASHTVRAYGFEVEVVAEPVPCGTGGALWNARDRLDREFLLINGDSWFDVPIAALWSRLGRDPQALGALALRHAPDADRYGAVRLRDGRIVGFAEKPAGSGAGLINGGVYALRREILGRLAPSCSLECDLFPALAAEGRLLGAAFEGYFIDIGTPESFARAQSEVRDQLAAQTLLSAVGDVA